MGEWGDQRSPLQQQFNAYSHAASLKNQLDQIKVTAGSLEVPGALSQGIKKAVKVETVKELRKKLKAAEKRERDFRKAEKRVKAENKAADKRRQIALDALVRVAKGNGINAVSAARTLLEQS